MQNKQSAAVHSVWDRLKASGLPIHSFLADHNGTLLIEEYQEPYSSRDPQRMFSGIASRIMVSFRKK